MTAAGKHIVEEFENLSDPEKKEVLVDILRMSSLLEYPQISDEELLAAADTIFSDYDRREASECPRHR